MRNAYIQRQKEDFRIRIVNDDGATEYDGFVDEVVSEDPEILGATSKQDELASDTHRVARMIQAGGQTADEWFANVQANLRALGIIDPPKSPNVHPNLVEAYLEEAAKLNDARVREIDAADVTLQSLERLREVLDAIGVVLVDGFEVLAVAAILGRPEGSTLTVQHARTIVEAIKSKPDRPPPD